MGPIPSLLLLFFYRFSFLLLDVSPFVGSAIGLGRYLFPLLFLQECIESASAFTLFLYYMIVGGGVMIYLSNTRRTVCYIYMRKWREYSRVTY